MNQVTDLNQGHNIVKYPNRKLYSTTLSRYIKLTSQDQREITIESLLRSDIPIRVIDARSGTNITAKTINGVVNGILKNNLNLSMQTFNFIHNLTNGADCETTNI